MKKKVVKIAAAILLILIGAIVALPFILEGRIGQIIKNKVNSNITGTFDFADASLSLIRSFPNAHLRIKEAVLTTAAPFEGDTLFSAASIDLSLSVYELFKGASEPIKLRELTLEKAYVNIVFDEEERPNYEIAKEKDSPGEDPSGESGFTLDLQEYGFTDSRLVYTDKAGGIYLDLTGLQHKGSGDLSLNESRLDTRTEGLVSLSMDGTEYLNRHKVVLDALLGIDLQTNTYTFLENKGLVNQLPLVFEGFVRVEEDFNKVDITFETPSSDFRNFLALFPEKYSKDINGVSTTGDFVVKGEFKGRIDEEHIPAFRIDIRSDKASFKYPDLPKSVDNIVLAAEIINETGLVKDTYVTVEKASFNIDQDRFAMEADLRDLTGNTRVNAHIDANMNLANLSKAYPYAAEQNLKGLLKADVTTAFDMATLENKQYAKTRTSGKLSLEGFEYNSEELTAPARFSLVSIDFKPERITLNRMQGNLGKTDFDIKGTLSNLLGFMFNKEDVEGVFSLESNTFSLNDFMVEDTEATSGENKKAETASVKIPSFLNCSIDARAQTVLYDNLVLRDVEGNIKVKDETATLSNFSSSLFKGKLLLDGSVSTKGEVPVFDMKLGVEQFQLAEAFSNLDLLKALAPVASALQGKLNSRISLSGILSPEFTPKLESITGDVLAEIFETSINTNKANVLNAMASQLQFFDPAKLNLSGLKTTLSFKDGVVTVRPMTFKYQDIAVTVDGSHSFDNQLNYRARLDVPARYLGSEVNSLIARINDNSLEDLTIPVGVSIGGNYSSPQVKTDLTTGVKDLTASLVEIQKQKLLNQGKEKASTLLEGLLAGKKADSTGTKTTTTDEVKKTLGNILTSGTQKTDSTRRDSTAAGTPNQAVKEAAKSVLGGLLKKKKKDSVVVKKDSVN
ncbi:AsmA-like C-terminal region [Muriicola jejuensis]|uniref:AsmA family protein n=1 Tax=Muriicola jejuensis TaxID=504488 RepID=A0A6P0UA40_9FLAO|nr:AsmA-like C-terminal region-containing protein [Muriicola jejuensis]NER09432.1 AsmA family protein [Muriicola jejuensis]SMP08703.1 AsmA-like C-terminal region [Muriicola jejuensis]